MKLVNMSDIIVSERMMETIQEVDEFNAAWNVGGLEIEPVKLESMRVLATIESVGSSNRIEGNRMSDVQIETLFRHVAKQSFRSRDEQEVAGYADLLDVIFENYQNIPLTENYVKQLHKILLNYSAKDERHRGEYKKTSNRVAAFDAAGNEIGTVFQTASPFDTPRLMDECIRWTNVALKGKTLHPIVAIGIFIVHFLAIHPFADGNGRMSRALTTLLMLKSGYKYMPYASMESVVEANKDAYYFALHETQKTIFNAVDGKTNYTPWLDFFIATVASQKRKLEAKIASFDEPQEIVRITQSEQAVVDLFAKKTNWSVSEIAAVLKRNIETVKKTVYNLAKKGVLEKRGTTKSAYYILKATSKEVRINSFSGTPNLLACGGYARGL